MTHSLSRQGVYIITPTSYHSPQLLSVTETALQCGVGIVQFRHKSPTNPLSIATALLQLCRAYQKPFIINDHLQLAIDIGADGVHLGKDDIDIATARKQLGTNAIIGVSCYDSLAKAKRAEQQGATYVAFGRFFASSSKPEASPAPVSLLTQAHEQLSIPIVAIGGINPMNAKQLVDAGADYLAVIDCVYGQVDTKSAVTQLLNSLPQ